MELQSMPRYTAAEAGRLAGLDAGRVRRWLRGYSHHGSEPESGGGAAALKRPAAPGNPAANGRYATFLDLIDLLFVNCFLVKGFNLQEIGKALSEAESIIGGGHFAQRVYFTDGKEVYLKIANGNSANLLRLMAGGRWAASEAILGKANQVEFDSKTGFAERWYPFGKEGGIVLDPSMNFGAPSIFGKRIKTSNIYDLYVAEHEDVAEVTDWMGLQPFEVKAAVEFEQALAT